MVMNTSVKYLTGLFFGLILMITAGAQPSDYLPGYIVLSDGDTLYGEVMDRKDGIFPELLNKIRFQPETGRRKKFRPRDIRGYRRGGDHFVSLWIHTEYIRLVQRYYSIPEKGEQVFMKVVSHGPLTYLHWEYIDGEFNTIEFVPLFKRSGSEELVRVTQGVLGLKKKRLAEYFRDCPELVDAIRTNQLSSPFDIINFGHPCR